MSTIVAWYQNQFQSQNNSCFLLSFFMFVKAIHFIIVFFSTNEQLIFMINKYQIFLIYEQIYFKQQS
jgi:hypothetical protein